MLIDDLQNALECWASRPTWFSSHPSDVKELRKAVSQLKGLGQTPTQEELFVAIYSRVVDLPKMLGSPQDIEQACRVFASKIYEKL